MRAAEAGRYELIVSDDLLEEVENVLLRPKFRRYLPEEDVPAYLERLRLMSRSALGSPGSTIAMDESAAVTTEDPDDDYLVVLGIGEIIISGDRHLLALRSTGTTAVRVLTPREFLDELTVTTGLP